MMTETGTAKVTPITLRVIIVPMSDEWYTPDYLFRTLSDLYGPFTMDVCATPASARAQRFFTRTDDGLAQLWEGVCWCAPPYSNPLPWVQKAIVSTTGYRQDE